MPTDKMIATGAVAANTKPIKPWRHSSRPLKLTPAGRFFQLQAQQMLDRMVEVQDATKRIAGGGRTWYGMGFVPSTLYGCAFIQVPPQCAYVDIPTNEPSTPVKRG